MMLWKNAEEIQQNVFVMWLEDSGAVSKPTQPKKIYAKSIFQCHMMNSLLRETIEC